jgi:crotonobetainyl-CoA:carnitine CoA-transferase CaiB-like acyl-CoA transferase
MPAFGLSGPYRDFVALGAGLEMFSGLAWQTGAGYGDGRPHLLGFPITDCLAGLHATLGALALLRSHGRDHLVVTQLASALNLVSSTLAAEGGAQPGSWQDEVADPESLLTRSDLQDDFELVNDGRARPQRYLRPAWSGLAPTRPLRGAPGQGEHSFQILTSLAGVDRDAFQRLRQARVTSQTYLPSR